ncbi:MAG: hypothetical protein KF700_07095 [Hyphomonadaceae bacterium]|nr:hypothetical protein [Hyphomonadaceae bacterium]
MYFDDEDDKDERDPFALFGEIEHAEDQAEDPVQELSQPARAEEPVTITPDATHAPTGGFSWAGFAGGMAAFVWIAGAIGGPLSYFGVDGVMGMDPAMQAGLIALAFGPALLFWVAASAAGEALKARRLAAELTRMAHNAYQPAEAGEAHAQKLSNTVKTEIEALNDAVATALSRLSELETAAQRNAALFDQAVAASRENTEQMSVALQRERDALADINGDLKEQTEAVASSIGRQVRLMREASKLVKTEVDAAEEALSGHLSSFAASASALGEHTTAFHQAADNAQVATGALNKTMSNMLDGLTEATRLTDAARQSTEQAVIAANETASAVRETTRSAVFEAKRAAQLIRAEASAMQEAAVDTLAKLQEAAQAARLASQESQAAADRQTAAIEKRLSALASTAGAKKAPAPAARPAAPVQQTRVIEREPVRVAAPEVTTLHAAASAAVARGATRGQIRTEAAEPRRTFKGFGGWGNFMPPQPRMNETPKAANEDEFDLVSFERAERRERNPDMILQNDAIDLVIDAGVDLGDVLQAGDLERIASSSRQGAPARRRAVIDAAPVAVNRIARHLKRHSGARDVADAFRARPDLAKSDKKGEGSDLVRAYLLIDAALA